MRSAYLFWFVAILACLVSAPGAAQSSKPGDISPEGPFLLSADEVTYDVEKQLVTASGNVEISDRDRVLFADTISYSLPDGIVRASGNISLIEPSGAVIFAEQLELDDTLKTGFISGVRMLMADDSRFAANGARRYANGDTELAKAVYSPCKLCPGHPERAPLWQIKASRVIHDSERKVIKYKNAVLEIFGVPVVYTPYFEHSDPTVKRKSGFLPPRFGTSSELGFKAEIPYFFNIAPNRDLTVAPLFTSEEGVVLAGEYRAMTLRGQYEIAGSGTYVDKRNDLNERQDEMEVRGHLASKGRFDIDDTWRWGFDANRTTDDTYLRRYDISSADTLTSDLFLEGFHGRSYANASAFAFQGLRIDDDAGTTPFVAPLLEYQYVSDPTSYGSRYVIDLNAVSLQRREGTDTARLSVRSNWNLPYTSPIGDVYTLSAGLAGDVYWINDAGQGGALDGPADDGVEGRVMPQLALDWRYPFVRQNDTTRQLIEPVAQLVYSPDVDNSSNIPNEDSISVEFDETNLFSQNRFPGFDRIETGLRLNYGFKASLYGDGGGYTNATIGQVLRLDNNSDFDINSGLSNDSSDIVAAVTIAPNEHIDLVGRIRVDPDDLTVRRNEVYAAFSIDRLQLTGSYVFFDEDLTADLLDQREELFVSGKFEITPNWSFSSQLRRDLSSDGGTINAGAGLRYENECLIFEVAFERDFTRDRDVEPSTNLNFRVVLKTLN